MEKINIYNICNEYIKNQTKNEKRLLSPLPPYFVRSLGNDFYSAFIYNNFCKEE